MSTGTGRVVPFNEVDEAVHGLDTDVEPWSVQLEIRVAGSLDEARLRSAVADGLARHPMARARKVPAPTGEPARYGWEIAPEPDVDPLGVVDCPDDDALSAARAELQSRPLSLTESPPLRLRLARHHRGDLVMVAAHHAAMDGFGALRLLRSVARAYEGGPDPVPPIDPLAARELRALVGGGGARTRARRLRLLAEKSRDLAVPPARIVAVQGDEGPGYGLHHVRLSEEETARLVGGDAPGTVNDILVAALHLAIDGWNRRHGAAPRRIGVMVPVNLRPEDRRQEVVGNLLLPVRTSTDRADRSTPAATLDAVAAQSRRFKEHGVGAALIEVLGRPPISSLGVRKGGAPVLHLLARRLSDSALLSNLGALDEPPWFGASAGDTTEVWFSAPSRMPLGLSVGTVTVAGRLHVVFRYRHPLFGAEAARAFAKLWLATLARVAAA